MVCDTVESKQLKSVKDISGVNPNCIATLVGFSFKNTVMKYPKIKVNCKQCGKPITTNKKRLEEGRGKYCSRDCLYKSKVKNTTFVCLVCGKKVTLTAREYGTRTKPAMLCSYSCAGLYRSGDKHGMWRGGFYKHNGYVMKWVGPKKHKRLHRILVEKHISRLLNNDEIVHHRNMDKSDNKIENLQIMTRAEHIIKHDPRGWKQRKEA